MGEHKENKDRLNNHEERIQTNENRLADNDEKQKIQDDRLDEHDDGLKKLGGRLGEAEGKLAVTDITLERLQEGLDKAREGRDDHTKDIGEHEEALKSIGKDLAGVHEMAHEREYRRGDEKYVTPMLNKYSETTENFKERSDQIADRKRKAGEVYQLNFKSDHPVQDDDESRQSALSSRQSELSSNGSGDNSDGRRRLVLAASHRRLPASYASMCPSEQVLARRRLVRRPNSHLVVLEQLMGKINRLNVTN